MRIIIAYFIDFSRSSTLRDCGITVPVHVWFEIVS